jgi:hypothetical protein
MIAPPRRDAGAQKTKIAAGGELVCSAGVGCCPLKP